MAAGTGKFEVKNIVFPEHYIGFEIIDTDDPKRPVRAQIFETVHAFEPVCRNDLGFPLFVDRPEQIILEKLRWRFDKPTHKDLFDMAVCSLVEPDLWKNLMESEEFCADLIARMLQFVETSKQWKTDYGNELLKFDIHNEFLPFADVDVALQTVKEHIARAMRDCAMEEDGIERTP